MNNNVVSSFVLGALTGASIAYGFITLVSPRHDVSVASNGGGGSGGASNPQESTNALSDLLQNTSIEYLLMPARKPVVVIEYKSLNDDYRSSIDFALMLMEDNNLVSIPVVDLEKRRYVGMLSVVDIVSFLVSNIKDNENSQELAAALRSVSISEVMKYNKEPFLPLIATAPLTLLLHVMATLADEVPVMGSEHQIVNIANRIDVLRFIRENIDVLGPRADSPVHTLLPASHVGSSALEIIDSDTRVIDALKIMDKTGVSELAITEKSTGRLTGNLVAADLRRLSVYNLARLYEPVSKFAVTNDSVVWVERSASLRTVLSKFVETKTPVVWVVDAYKTFKPIESITLRSVMKLILDFLNPQS